MYRHVALILAVWMSGRPGQPDGFCCFWDEQGGRAVLNAGLPRNGEGSEEQRSGLHSLGV